MKNTRIDNKTVKINFTIDKELENQLDMWCQDSTNYGWLALDDVDWVPDMEDDVYVFRVEMVFKRQPKTTEEQFKEELEIALRDMITLERGEDIYVD